MRLPEPPAASIAAAALATAVALAGCATSSIDLAPEASDRPWQPQTSAAGDIVPGCRARPRQASHDYALPASPALASVSPPAALEAAHAYTLPELIDLAESANPLTRIAWNDARNAALAVGLPRPPTCRSCPRRPWAGTRQTTGRRRRSSATRRATPPCTAPSRRCRCNGCCSISAAARRVEAAEQASIASNVAFTAVHQQVIHDVTVAYYRYEAARSRAQRPAGLANADAILAASRARLKHGVGTVVELAQATQNRAQANLALVQANGTESDGYLALVSALGISPLSKPTVAALPKRPLPPRSARRSTRSCRMRSRAAPTCRARSRSKRPIARRSRPRKPRSCRRSSCPRRRRTRAAARPSPRCPRSATAPTVNLNGSRYGGGVFLGVTIPLYDGGLRSAVLMQARNDAESASARLTRTKEEAVRQVVAAQNAVQTSLASHDAAKALVDAAQTSYDAALTAYRNGVGSVTDATIAQSQLLAARNAEVDSYAGALSAAAARCDGNDRLGAVARRREAVDACARRLLECRPFFLQEPSWTVAALRCVRRLPPERLSDAVLLPGSRSASRTPPFHTE